MSVIFATEKLVDDIAATFAADGTACNFDFGWRSPQKQKATNNRIVYVPGDPTGNVGAFAPAKYPGRNPRPLATLVELLTVQVSANDPTQATNERAQYHAARLLLDAWYRAAYLSSRGTFEIVSSRWNLASKANEVRAGAEVTVVVAIQSMIPDEPVQTVDAGLARAEVVPQLDAVNDGEGTDDTTVTAGATIPHAIAATTEPIVLEGYQTIDGVYCDNSGEVLVKDMADPSQNGLYVPQVGAWVQDGGPYPLGFFVHVADGTVNGGAGFQVTNVSPLTFSRTSP